MRTAIVSLAFGLIATSAEASTFLAFSRLAGTPNNVSANGCELQSGPAVGSMTPSPEGGCLDAQLGYLDGGVGSDLADEEDAGQNGGQTASRFVYPPLAEPALAQEFRLGGPTSITVYLATEVDPVGTLDNHLLYHLDELTATGALRHIAFGVAVQNMQFTLYSRISHPGERNTGTFTLPDYTVAKGSRLQLNLGAGSPDNPQNRILFGESYDDAGIELGAGGGGGAGGVPPSALVILLAAGLLRHRNRIDVLIDR